MLGFFLKMENSRIWIRNEEMEEVEQRNSFFFFLEYGLLTGCLKKGNGEFLFLLFERDQVEGSDSRK